VTDTPQQIVERALELSQADGCVALVEHQSSANIRFANNTLTTNGVMSGVRVTVISMINGATGTAAGSVTRAGTDLTSIADLVAASETAARAAGPASDAQPLVPGGVDAAWSEPPATTSIAVFATLAPALGEAFARARAADRLLFGYAEHEISTTYVGSSTGLRRRHAQPTGSLLINAKSPDFKQSAYVGVPTADFTDIDVAALDDEVATRLSWSQNRIDLPAGRYETLLPPSAVVDPSACMVFSASGRDAADGRSVFSKAGGTRIGDQLCNDTVRVSLTSDPATPGLEAAPFVIAHENDEVTSVFDNGLPLTATEWITDGVLTNLLTSRSSAAKTGLGLSPFVDNLTMTATIGGSGRSLDEMIAATERGLLVTCLWYIRTVDPQTLLLTGLTRDGVYLIEDGKVTGMVNNFRFNESPVGMLHRITEAGAPQRALGREFGEYFNRMNMPTLRIGDFNMSSVSQAS
jgi:predicted Zn-dependent protease